RSFEDVLAAVAEKVKTARKGEWILGGRWDHESWQDKKLPSHEKLSEISPDNPVWLRRVDGHAGLANALAMKIVGVTRESETPSGGDIIRTKGGDLTGVFVDNAMNVFSVRAGGGRNAADLLLKAQDMCLAVGLTSVHDAGVSPREIAAYRELEQSGKLKMRIYAMLAGREAMEWFDREPPKSGEMLSVRACKLVMDGAMGSRGAWLLEPYSDRPVDQRGERYCGLNVTPPDALRDVARHALRRGYQLCIHAIGDRANREVLDAYESALHDAGGDRGRNARFRIEHAQLLSPVDLPRFASLGVIASMQPTHCTSDMRWVEARVGSDRAEGAYAWKALLDSGARLAGGSDFPVESQNPLLGIYAAITRQTTAGEPLGGWRPTQRLSREQALRLFTIDAAYAAFEERETGTIEAGKRADFTILDRDIFACEERDIAHANVLATVVGGKVVYEAAKKP
ncbi:MAG: amidohydrolase, partial [Planctomycetes bacterium]|nr:amidohydrolase [Planctomycetota bacterium]